MALVISQEHDLLRDAAKGFLAEHAPVSGLRTLRDSDDPFGYDPALWQRMTEMGWAGILVPEKFGGLDFGIVGAGILMEEMGRTLSASPFFSSAIMAATLLSEAASDKQKQLLLPQIAAGKAVVALAVDENRSHDPVGTNLSAKPSGNGFVLNGKKDFVLDGHVADKVIVASRTAGKAGSKAGLSLFLLDADSAGLELRRRLMVDSRNAADLVFDGVKVNGDQLLGTLDEGYEPLEKALDVGRACLSAEMLGTAGEAFERTLGYLKERKQFGAPIGSFQVLQHRAAHLFSEIEMLRSVVLKALQALQAGDASAAFLASLAKAKAAQVADLATSEAIQMHGGVGMTDEFDIGFFIKRAKVAAATYGDYYFHADRFARTKGY
jgi:acyl-CoA dehydrogenase